MQLLLDRPELFVTSSTSLLGGSSTPSLLKLQPQHPCPTPSDEVFTHVYCDRNRILTKYYFHTFPDPLKATGPSD